MNVVDSRLAAKRNSDHTGYDPSSVAVTEYRCQEQRRPRSFIKVRFGRPESQQPSIRRPHLAHLGGACLERPNVSSCRNRTFTVSFGNGTSVSIGRWRASRAEVGFQDRPKPVEVTRTGRLLPAAPNGARWYGTVREKFSCCVESRDRTRGDAMKRCWTQVLDWHQFWHSCAGVRLHQFVGQGEHVSDER